jgi:hypothetical protein
MWTLALTICTVVYVVITLLKHYVNFKKPVYPSDAIIEQVLPPEILEQIFLQLDYTTFKKCARVSRYWRHFTSDNSLQRQIFQRDISWRIDPRDLLEDWDYSQRAFELDKIKWLEYSDSYDPVRNFKDQRLARDMGKKLIDVNFESALFIRRIFGELPLRRRLVKIRCHTYSYLEDNWIFQAGSAPNYSLFTIPRESLPNVEWRSKTECELIVELADVTQYHFTQSHHFRYLNEKARWVKDCDLEILALLFVPCFLADYLQLVSVSRRYWLNSFFVVIVVVLQLVIYVTFLANQLQSNRLHYDRARKFFIMGMLLIPIILFFYRTALELGFLVGCVFGCAGYTMLQADLHHKNHLYSKHITFISALLVTLVNDWKLAISAFQSGTIFFTLLFNTALFVYFILLAILASTISKSVQNVSALTANIGGWNKTYVRDAALAYLAVIFVTLYAPETTRKVT